jgi:hypothetical protein
VCGKGAEMALISPGFCMRDYYSLKIGRRLFDQIATNRLDFALADPPQIFLAVAQFFEVNEGTFVAAIEQAKELKKSTIPKKTQDEEMWSKEMESPGFYMRDFYALNMGWRVFDQIVHSNTNFGLENPNDLFAIIENHFEVTEDMIRSVLQSAKNPALVHEQGTPTLFSKI